MNEILQQRIEEAAAAIAPFNRMSQKRDYFVKGADFSLQNQWISVDEALPPQEEKDRQYSVDVMARASDGTSEYNDYAYYDYINETWCSLTRECSFGRVTHWMPIPSLKGGEK